MHPGLVSVALTLVLPKKPLFFLPSTLPPTSHHMDPLSVTASIIAVAGPSSKVHQYLNHVKVASKDRAKCAVNALNLNSLPLNLRFHLEEGAADNCHGTRLSELSQLRMGYSTSSNRCRNRKQDACLTVKGLYKGCCEMNARDLSAL